MLFRSDHDGHRQDTSFPESSHRRHRKYVGRRCSDRLRPYILHCAWKPSVRNPCRQQHDEIVKELEALTGKKDSRCGGHNGHRAKSRDIMAAEYGFSSRTAARMLRLNYLIPEFKKLVDEGNVALMAAVDMSFLEEGEQQAIWRL